MDYDVIFQFNNIGQPFLMVKIQNQDNQITTAAINLEPSSLVNGFLSIEQLTDNINNYLYSKNASKSKALFLLNLGETFKITTVLPNIPDRKFKKIYDDEFAKKVPNSEEYYRFSTTSASSKGKIVYDYLTKKHFIEDSEKLLKLLKFSQYEIALYPEYLYKHINNISSENYAYIYEENNIANLLLISNKQMISHFAFVANQEGYNLNLTACIDKHSLNIEKIKFNELIANKEIAYLNKLNYKVKEFVIGN